MKIYLIGDSISIHYGPYLNDYLKGLIEYSRKEGEEEALLNLDRPQGANGGDSSMVLEFLKAKAEAGGIDADVVLINCGLHDIKTDPRTGAKQVPIEQYKQNLRSIVRLVRQMGKKMIWITTTPCDERVHNRQGMAFHRFASDCIAYSAVAENVMKNSGVPVLDLFTFTCNLGSDLYCDHVHFHDHIRRLQAAYIAGWLMGFLVTFAHNERPS